MSRPYQISIGLFLIALSACQDPSTRPESRGTSLQTAGQESFSGAQLKELQSLEADLKQVERNTWGPELRARPFEGIFVDLLDRLNREDERLALVREFPVGRVSFGVPSDARELQHGIQRSRLDSPSESLDFQNWQAQLLQWMEAGWRLEFQECRQSGFRQDDPFAPISQFDLTLHLRNKTEDQRAILRGKLQVQWRVPEDGDGAQIEAVLLEDAEWLTRIGEPVFRELVHREMMPHTQTRFIDPVIVADFDGNGRSDLLFSGCNVLYSGIEGGGLRSDSFVIGTPPVVYTSVYADVTGDGLRDYVIVDREGVLMYAGGSERLSVTSLWKAPSTLHNASALTVGDVDADGDLDLWLTQYKMPYVAGQMPTPFYDANDGFPSFLLINDGTGVFSDHTEDAGLSAKRFRRTYSASFFDLDGDADLDLINISDFAGIDVYLNDGSGHFTDVTDAWVAESHAFGMAHAFGDFDRDGTSDILMIGMNSSVADRLDSLSLWPEKEEMPVAFRPTMAFGNRLYLGRDDRLVETPLGTQIARSGWAWGVRPLDFDNDGDLDVFIANGHKTRASVRDYEEEFWCHDIFLGSSEMDPTLELYFRKKGTELYGAGFSYGGYQRNAFYLNLEGKEFVEVAYLMGLAADDDGRNVICEDLDLDGLVDIVVTSSEVWPKSRQAFRLYQNLLPVAGHWVGFRLPTSLAGQSLEGAEWRLRAGDRDFVTVVASGDGYRTQAAGLIHFGLGQQDHFDSLTIRTVGGRQFRYGSMELGRYHTLAPSGKE